jgi:hypothetical protein
MEKRTRRTRAAATPGRGEEPIAMADDRQAAQITDGPPSEDRIRERAYALYLERGATDGLADEDWFTAEQELRTSPLKSSE